MPSFYLNSYAPLVASKAGREASMRYGIEPFVDGSIRREPDLEHDYPAISCLCRADKFAPRLKEDDIVAYMLRKDRYGQKERQRRLTAVLRVLAVRPSHIAGAAWYQERGLALPNNCLVHGNPAKPFEQSHHRHRTSNTLGPEQTYREWDVGYRARAMRFPTFVVCERLYCDLSWNAPEVTESLLVAVFGCIPATRNPRKWTITHAERLLSQLSIAVPLSSP
jgi:hypothetical protein